MLMRKNNIVYNIPDAVLFLTIGFGLGEENSWTNLFNTSTLMNVKKLLRIHRFVTNIPV